jgi:hypothetical protein
MAQFKKLFGLFLSLDFRDKDKNGSRKIIGILVAYLFTNSFLSFSNFMGFNEYSFAILSFSINIFFIAFVVLNDFDNLFLAKNHFQGLTNLPVKQGSFFAAKFVSASLMIFAFYFVSSVSQLIFFYFYNYSLEKVVLFFICSLLFNFTFMGFLLFLYVIVLNNFTGKSNLIVYILQFVFFLFIIYSSTFSAKAVKLGKKDLLDIELVRYMPQVFFVNGIYEPVFIPVILLIALAVFYGLYKFMSANFFELQEKISKVKEKSKRKKIKFTFWGAFIHKYILRNNIQRASYDLLGNQLRNSRFLRVKYVPMVLFPVIFCIIGTFFSKEFLVLSSDQRIGKLLSSQFLILSPSITFMTILSIRMLFSNTKIADEHSPNANTIMEILPIKNNAQLNLGISKFIYANFYFPLIIIMTGLLLMRLNILTIAVNLLYISSAIYLLNTIFLQFDKRLPFSLDSSKFNSASKFGEVLFNMLLGVIIFIIQIFVFQNAIFVISAVVVFLGISFLINRN